MNKRSVTQRLNIIKGQIDGLTNLIKQKENCRKITSQFYAINVALKKTIELYLQNNLTSCLKSINFEEKEAINFLLKEIIKNE